MTEQANFGFKNETCLCGATLAELTVQVESYMYDNFPQGKCPKCGKELLLKAPPLDFTPAPPEPEPVAEVVESVRARRTKKKD